MKKRATPKQRQRWQEIADAIAVLVENEMELPQEVFDVLTNLMSGHMTALANITTAKGIRKHYPALREAAEYEAQRHGMTFREWMRNNEHYFNLCTDDSDDGDADLIAEDEDPEWPSGIDA